MSCARSSGEARAGDPSSGLGSSSSTYVSSTYSLKGKLENGSKVSSGRIEKFIGASGATTGGSGATTKGICASSTERSKTEEEDREARK